MKTETVKTECKIRHQHSDKRHKEVCLAQPAPHAPTPWELIEVKSPLGLLPRWKIKAKDTYYGDKIIMMTGNKANAAFIVKCVNGHAELLEALKVCDKQMSELYRTMDNDHWFKDDLVSACRIVREAITKAEARS